MKRYFIMSRKKTTQAKTWRKIFCLALWLTLLLPLVSQASEEGTRHITGSGVNIYFMNDKVFGSVQGHPIWAIYNCGSDINGEIDIRGNFHAFEFAYHQKGDRVITGNFGPLSAALGKIVRKDRKFIYQVLVGDKEYAFSIRYEKIEADHLVNSIIEGEIEPGKPLKLTVNGHLCPFATTGIILIVAGSFLLSS
jgi:hypothetical protein